MRNVIIGYGKQLLLIIALTLSMAMVFADSHDEEDKLLFVIHNQSQEELSLELFKNGSSAEILQIANQEQLRITVDAKKGNVFTVEVTNNLNSDFSPLYYEETKQQIKILKSNYKAKVWLDISPSLEDGELEGSCTIFSPLKSAYCI